MAASTTIYRQATPAFMSKKIDFLADNIKIALLTSAYTPTFATDAYWSTISGNEVSSSGYTAGGILLASKSLTYNATSSLWVATAGIDPSWTGVTFTARYAIMYDWTGTASTSPLLTCTDFGSDQTASAETFTLHIPTTGLFQVAVVTGS